MQMIEREDANLTMWQESIDRMRYDSEALAVLREKTEDVRELLSSGRVGFLVVSDLPL